MEEIFMLKSLYSGVSGMISNQTKMDVISNNIANVSTTAFKSSRVNFQDMLSDTISTAQSPDDAGKGGVNPTQVGLGTSVSSIDNLMSDGSLNSTGRSLDFAIEDDGFFVVADSSTVTDTDADDDVPGEESFTKVRYTRDGAFYRDSEGSLVNASGYKVLGYPAYYDDNDDGDTTQYIMEADEANLRSIEIPSSLVINEDGELVKDEYGKYLQAVEDEDDQTLISLDTFSVDSSGLITAIGSDQNSYYLGRLAIASFTNPEGLDKLGTNTYGYTNNSGEAQYGMAGEGSFGTMNQGSLEMSNVDLATEFTDMIITSRAYQANSKSITTSDEMLQQLLGLK
jgi:flagellar hook protein FlgE